MLAEDVESTIVVIAAGAGNGLAVTGDNRWIVKGSVDGFVYLWPLEPKHLIDHALRVAGRRLNEAERTQYQITDPSNLLSSE